MNNGKWNMSLVAGVWVAYWLLFIIYLGNTRTPDYAIASTTEGEVVDIYDYRISAAGKNNNWAIKKGPVVRYYVDTVEYRWDSEKQSYLGLYAKGDKVTVIYNPDRPEEACIFGLIGYWINISEILVALLIIAIITVFITVVPHGYDDRFTKALKKY